MDVSPFGILVQGLVGSSKLSWGNQIQVKSTPQILCSWIHEQECIFGSAWRLVWSCAVESLYDDTCTDMGRVGLSKCSLRFIANLFALHQAMSQSGSAVAAVELVVVIRCDEIKLWWQGSNNSIFASTNLQLEPMPWHQHIKRHRSRGLPYHWCNCKLHGHWV